MYLTYSLLQEHILHQITLETLVSQGKLGRGVGEYQVYLQCNRPKKWGCCHSVPNI